MPFIPKFPNEVSARGNAEQPVREQPVLCTEVASASTQPVRAAVQTVAWPSGRASRDEKLQEAVAITMDTNTQQLVVRPERCLCLQ